MGAAVHGGPSAPEATWGPGGGEGEPQRPTRHRHSGPAAGRQLLGPEDVLPSLGDARGGHPGHGVRCSHSRALGSRSVKDVKMLSACSQPCSPWRRGSYVSWGLSPGSRHFCPFFCCNYSCFLQSPPYHLSLATWLLYSFLISDVAAHPSGENVTTVAYDEAGFLLECARRMEQTMQGSHVPLTLGPGSGQLSGSRHRPGGVTALPGPLPRSLVCYS